MIAMQEFVVPKSIPKTFAIFSSPIRLPIAITNTLTDTKEKAPYMPSNCPPAGFYHNILNINIL